MTEKELKAYTHKVDDVLVGIRTRRLAAIVHAPLDTRRDARIDQRIRRLAIVFNLFDLLAESVTQSKPVADFVHKSRDAVLTESILPQNDAIQRAHFIPGV